MMGLVILVVIVTAGILLCGFEYAYRASLDKRDWTIKLLTEQIRLAQGYDEARRTAATVRTDASDRELSALALLAGPLTLFETFIHLTHKVSVGFQWDPLKERIEWEPPGRPSPEEIMRNAALLVLWHRGYVGGVLPAGYGGYAAVASNEAMAVKAVLDRLPQSKAQIHGEQQLSLALPPALLHSQASTLN
ncbi:MAG: hypothetical protein ACE5MG_02770 [Candidatus Methylomirabilales bacterium]